jgi:hypothetical protein
VLLAVAAFAWFCFRLRFRPPGTGKQSSSGDDCADTPILTYGETVTHEETGAGMFLWDAVDWLDAVRGSDSCERILAGVKGSLA